MEDLEARVFNKQNDNYEDTHHTFYYIYIVTNLINGKKYIGKRMCHCPIEEDIYFGSGKAIKNALKKYSIDNFKKEILEICKNYQECNEREKYWIKYFNADKDDNFYNIASGGEGGNTYSGLSHEEIERIKKIKSAQTSGKNNPRYGTTWSDETRRKILKALHDYYEKTGLSSISGKFGPDNKLSKKIICVETNQIFIGVREASRKMGIPSPNIIRSLKSNGRFTAGRIDDFKLHWKYINDD